MTTAQDHDDLILRRSDTGHFVLLEPRTQTTVVDEDLGRAYARMSELLAAERPPAPAPSSSFEFRARTQIWALALFVALPLLFLLAIERRVAKLERSEVLPPAEPTINSGASPAPQPETGGAPKSLAPRASKGRPKQTRERAVNEHQRPAGPTASDGGDEDGKGSSGAESTDGDETSSAATG